MTIFCYIAVMSSSWDCKEYVPEDDPNPPPDEGCNTVEDWLGVLSDFVMLSFFGVWMRLGIIIVFGVALCRISCLVGKLAEYGFV